MENLKYHPLERLRVERPVDRVDYVVEHCRGQRVLDLGGYDETAQTKRGTKHWLHGSISSVAREVVGVDSSELIPRDGVRTGENGRFIRGDVTNLASVDLGDLVPDVIVAGELIEHLPNALAFMQQVKGLFPGKRFIATTPNATSLSNAALAAVYRESNHHDHLQVYSYKTLNTLCLRAGFSDWRIVPYHMRYTEMALRNTGAVRALVLGAERLVQLAATAMPLLSGGFILDVQRL